MVNFLVTGAAGFIGAKLVEELITNNYQVIGLDNLNDYYDPNLKKMRLANIEQFSIKKNYWKFFNEDITDLKKLNEIFCKFEPDIVIHLAAQAGVRYSIANPSVYIQSNLVGFGNILEMCRNFKVKHLLYASSSSVYGANRKLPYAEKDHVNHPISLYAATKKSNELMAHSYSHLYGIKTTGIRFFTVYGPWGRPDMAPMIFAKSIMASKPIEIFNNGNMKRDFTYIDDVVKALIKCTFKIPEGNPKFNVFDPDPSSSFAPYQLLNIGNGKPVNLNEFINLLESALGKKAIKNFRPMQKGDVLETFSNTTQLEKITKYTPKTNIVDGVEKFSKWFLKYGHKF